MDKRDIDIIVNVKREYLNYINGIIAQGILNQDDEMRKFVEDNNLGIVNVKYNLIKNELVEKILCAAILRKSENTCPKVYWENDIYKCELGYRHADILHRFKGIVRTDPDAQGFYTSAGRFVNRKEAWKIAKDAGQIMSDYDRDRELFSEDLY